MSNFSDNSCHSHDTYPLTDDSSIESNATPITKITFPLITKAKVWQNTLHSLNILHSDNADTIFDTGKMKIAVDMAIADAGATGHGVLPGTPSLNVQPAT